MEGIPRQYTKRKKEAKRTSNKKRKKDTQEGMKEIERKTKSTKFTTNKESRKKTDVHGD